MKTVRFWMLPALLLAGVSLAQNNQPAPEAEPPRAPGGFHRNGPPGNEGEHIDKWLEVLKQRNPEEFERMQKLRTDNPEEFRKVLHQKLQEFRTRSGGSLRDKPQIMKVLRDLPPEDREWVMQRLQTTGAPMMGGFNPEGRRGFPDFRHMMSPELEQAERQTRELTQRLRNAKTDEEKASAKQALREQVSKVFDLREKQRAEMVRVIDEKVTKLRQQLEDRKNRRDQLIEEELQGLAAGQPVPK